jgi:chemotaxis response regulator CheB
VPLLITQHTLEGFDESLSKWLASTGHQVGLARHGDIPTPGRVLLAPADTHMRVQLSGIELVPTNRTAEASTIDTMFETAAKCWGELCLAFVLSGMGRDGGAGMRALFDRGALTVAQAPHTCVVPSMPENARARGGVKRVLTPEEIVALLLKLAAIRASGTNSWKGM